MGIETVVLDIIEERRKSFFLKTALCFFSLIYRSISAVRNFLYDKKLFKSHAFPIPVVSVGNLVAGGTGKTPFVQKLVSALSQTPGEVAIVTRGYRSPAESQLTVASLGDGPLVSASLCGDEPYWLACHTKASIWVCKHRIQSLEKAALTCARIAFLEDGFQHRKVKRDIEIVLLSAADLFGKGYFLPRGYLRDSPKRLSQASFIVVTHLKQGFSEEEILQKIRPFSSSPILGLSSSYELKSELVGKKVGAFCGIAKPDSFFDALNEVEVVKKLILPDHRAPSKEELSQFALECKALGAECLICTEKDQVKLLDLPQLDLPIETLKMRLECIWNENVWKEMVQSIQTRM